MAFRQGCLLVACQLLTLAVPGFAADDANSQRTTQKSVRSTVELTPVQWQRLNAAVDRGLEFLATQQQADGSFRGQDAGQPAITSLCVMAFLSRGHLPDEGLHGQQISRAIDFVLSTQQPNGLFCTLAPGTHDWQIKGSYNHSISGVMLGEAYGMTGPQQRGRIHEALANALRFSRDEQSKRKRWPDDHGGWRYLMESAAIDSDLSVTSWHLMFYRSARNAEFEVPTKHIDEAMAYVRRCYDPLQQSFCYGLRGYGRTSFSRCMAGAGILSLSLGGEHQTDMARRAGGFVLAHPFDQFNRGGLRPNDQFFYGAYYCSQAMFQLGGEYWARFYPVLLQTLTENQRRDGSWEREFYEVSALGFCYTTALAVLALTPPYQLLPIYQR